MQGASGQATRLRSSSTDNLGRRYHVHAFSSPGLLSLPLRCRVLPKCPPLSSSMPSFGLQFMRPTPSLAT